MSEAKFTKGPWKAVDNGIGTPIVVAISEHNDSYDDMNKYSPTVCDIWGATYSPFKGDHFADAYLIAAAPEMYSMLESIAESLGQNDSKYDVDKCREVEMLLAKARGEHAK